MNESDFWPLLLSECPECELCERSYLDAFCDEAFYRTVNGATDHYGLHCGGIVVCEQCKNEWLAAKPLPGVTAD